MQHKWYPKWVTGEYFRLASNFNWLLIVKINQLEFCQVVYCDKDKGEIIPRAYCLQWDNRLRHVESRGIYWLVWYDGSLWLGHHSSRCIAFPSFATRSWFAWDQRMGHHDRNVLFRCFKLGGCTFKLLNWRNFWLSSNLLNTSLHRQIRHRHLVVVCRNGALG